MSTVSLWATFERDQQERYIKSFEDKQENIEAIDALETLMRGDSSASQTARRIADIYEPRIASKQRSSIGILWGNIAEATRCVGVAQCLSDLMGEIHNLPDVLDTGGYVVKQDAAIVWRGLPSWGWIYFEHGIDIDLPDGPDDTQWYAQAPGLLNSTMFAATLMKNDSFRVGMAFHADTAFREGVETLYDDTREIHSEWRMYISPAAVWVSIAGEQLYALSFGDNIDHSVFKNRTAWYRWGGKLFCPERWHFWKRRFDVLADWDEMDDCCRVLAKNAAKDMDVIEKKHAT